MAVSGPPLVRLDVGAVSLAVSRREAPGPTTLFIHGSWDDHHSWDHTIAGLDSVATVAYDRRGHSASTDVGGQGTISGDIADAAAVIERLELGSVHVVGHSYGACIAIVLATRRPELVRSLFLHEPPIFGLLGADHPALLSDAQASMRRAVELAAAGSIEGAAVEFVDNVAFGPGAWSGLFDAHQRATMLANIDTWIDQSRDPERLAVDVAALAAFPGTITLSGGTVSLPSFRAVTEIIAARLPAARRVTVDGAGHGAPTSHPEALAIAVVEHLAAATA